MTLVTDAVAGARRAAPGTTTSVDGGQDADRTADERSYPDEQEAGAWASVISEAASTVISRRPSRRAAVRLGCWRAACTAEGDISAGPITCRFVGPTGRQLFDDAVRLLRCEVGSSFGEPSVSSSCGGHQPRTARVSPRWNPRVAITVVSGFRPAATASTIDPWWRCREFSLSRSWRHLSPTSSGRGYRSYLAQSPMVLAEATDSRSTSGP